MFELYQKHKNFTKVGRIMGRSRDTVSKYVKEVAKRKSLEKRHENQLNQTTQAIIHAVKEELGIDLDKKPIG